MNTPRPLLALVVVPGARKGEGWLAVEFVRGRDLATALRDDPAAATALPEFLALMHERGVLHGDLNVRNVLWSHGHWTLLDLEGVRDPLHRLRSRSIADDWWVRIAGTMRDPERVRALHARFCELVGRPRDAQARWPDVATRALELASEYDRRLAERRARSQNG